LTATPAWAQGETVDNGNILVTPDGVGGFEAFRLDSIDTPTVNEFGSGAGLNLKLTGGTDYGVGGTPFTFVDQGSVVEVSGERTLTTTYAIPGPGDSLLVEIAETIHVPLTPNQTFTLEYQIHNVSAGPVGFSPRLVADLSPRGDTQAIGRPVAVGSVS